MCIYVYVYVCVNVCECVWACVRTECLLTFGYAYMCVEIVCSVVEGSVIVSDDDAYDAHLRRWFRSSNLTPVSTHSSRSCLHVLLY